MSSTEYTTNVVPPSDSAVDITVRPALTTGQVVVQVGMTSYVNYFLTADMAKSQVVIDVAASSALYQLLLEMEKQVGILRSHFEKPESYAEEREV